MDGDIGAMLQSVLSDPEQMAQITRLAQGLMSAQGEEGLPSPPGSSEGEPPPPAAGMPDFSQGEMKLFSTLGKAFAAGKGNSRSTGLLMAMRPYMKAEKQEKLDRAMKIARMVHVAGAVMKEYGGGQGNGI